MNDKLFLINQVSFISQESFRGDWKVDTLYFGIIV